LELILMNHLFVQVKVHVLIPIYVHVMKVLVDLIVVSQSVLELLLLTQILAQAMVHVLVSIYVNVNQVLVDLIVVKPLPVLPENMMLKEIVLQYQQDPSHLLVN